MIIPYLEKEVSLHFLVRTFFKNASPRKAVEAAPQQQILK